MSNSKNEVQDHLRRVPGPAKAGIILFILGRLADPPIQYLNFNRGWAARILTSVGLRAASSAVIRAGPGYGGLGTVPTLLTGLYTVATLRQCYWVWFTNSYEWPFSQAMVVILYNLVVDTYNTLSSTNALSTASPVVSGDFVSALGWKQWVGITSFVVGIAMETISEESRKKFKRDPKNKGKIDDTGLWSVVRHPNYLGYTLWRSGITLAGGNVGAAIGFAIFQIVSFCAHSAPALAGHMKNRYGEQWAAYEKRVPKMVIPGIW